VGVTKKKLSSSGDPEMTERLRLPFDRRSGEDRRKVYDLEYFLKGGTERRSRKERRHGNERRKDWVPISDWSSLWTGFLDIKSFLEWD
jgi:hypothetical protein